MFYSRSHSLLFTTAITTAIVTLTPIITVAQSDIRTERVQFQRGATSAVIEDSIRGYETVDYVLRANAGQYMNVSMATDSGANYFNILAPGETEVAMFNGSTGENQYEGTLPATGDYKIRVYMMRSAARRNEVANYRLEMIITGAGDRPASNRPRPTGDALVEGTQYNATGNVPCAMATGQPTGSCPFGVIRQGNGSGTVTITRQDRRTRTIFFENGDAIGYDRSQADSGAFTATREGDLTVIRIDQERYEIPDAVIFGG